MAFVCALRDIKHKYPLCTKNVKADLALPDSQIERKHTFNDPSTGQEVTISVMRERFLAPEVFFDPSIAKLAVPPLPKLVDGAIQSCAIDSRRKLYSTICLSVCCPHILCIDNITASRKILQHFHRCRATRCCKVLTLSAQNRDAHILQDLARYYRHLPKI
jgi:hypothetical protein